MQDNAIYNLITDAEGIKNSMNEALEMITALFKQKYMDKIAYELKCRQNEIINNPPKEIALLNTLKLFADEKTASDMDRIITTLNRVSTLINIKSENDRLVKALSDESVKNDGVYDVDKNCIKTLKYNTPDTTALIILLLCLFF